MLAQYASFIQGYSYYPSDFMLPFADWVKPGVLSSADLAVTAQVPNALAVNVSGGAQDSPGGNAWISGSDAMYRFYSDAQLSLAIATADATNPRIDLVVAGVDTTVTPNNPTIKVITGTPAATPAAPAIPAGYIGLAEVAVAANATTISTSNITDIRPYASMGSVEIDSSSTYHLYDEAGNGIWSVDQIGNQVVAGYLSVQGGATELTGTAEPSQVIFGFINGSSRLQLYLTGSNNGNIEIDNYGGGQFRI